MLLIWTSVVLAAVTASPLDRQLEVGAADGPVVEAWLFRTGCATCLEGEVFLTKAAADSRVRLHLRILRIEADPNKLLLLKLRELAGTAEDGILVLVLDDRMVFGLDRLRAELPGMLDALEARARGDLKKADRAAAAHQPLPPTVARRPEGDGGFVYLGELLGRYSASQQTAELRIARSYAETYSTWTVLAAGLVDGINPCAFSAMALLLSYLAMVGRGRRHLLLIGGIFCTTMFVCYLLEGMLLGLVLGAADRYEAVGVWVRWGIVAVTGVFACVSVYDAVLAARGRAKDMLLKLPGAVQSRLHSAVRGYAKTGGLVLATISLAVVIVLLETVCTGQLYLPTVQLLVRAGEHRYIWGLLLYNLAFIFPLIVLFLLVSLGISSEKFSRLYRRAMPAVKIAMAVVFVALTVLLAISAAAG